MGLVRFHILPAILSFFFHNAYKKAIIFFLYFSDRLPHPGHLLDVPRIQGKDRSGDNKSPHNDTNVVPAEIKATHGRGSTANDRHVTRS